MSPRRAEYARNKPSSNLKTLRFRARVFAFFCSGGCRSATVPVQQLSTGVRVCIPAAELVQTLLCPGTGSFRHFDGRHKPIPNPSVFARQSTRITLVSAGALAIPAATGWNARSQFGVIISMSSASFFHPSTSTASRG